MALRTSERRLAASAAIIAPNDRAQLQSISDARQKWQKPAWDNYDKLGEIHYPANFLGGSLSRFEFHVKRKIFRNGKTIFEDLADDDCNKAMDEFENGDGMSELARLFAINWTVAADCWLIGRNEPGGVEWKLYSSEAVELAPEAVEGRKIIVEGEVYPADTMYRRVWRSHPKRRKEADGAMQSLEHTCKQLVDLNDSISAQVQSRLASAGLLFIPNTIQIPAAQSRPDGTGLTAKDPLIGYLMDVFELAIQDRSSAAGRVPIALRGPETAGQHIRHIVLDRLLNDQELALRNELRHAIFTGLDLPPEVTSGLGKLSHWTSWSVMDSSYRIHMLPIGEAWADAVTKIYLRPYLLAAQRSAEEIRDFCIVADGSNAVVRVNEADDTRQLRDRGAISLKALRERNSLEETDAMPEEEMIRWIGEKLLDPYLATFGLDIAKKIDWSKVAKTQPKPGPPAAPGNAERPKVGNSNTTAGRPGGGAGGNAGGVKGKGRASDSSPEALLVAYRAGFKTIGARLRSRFNAPGQSARKALIKGVASDRIHIALGNIESDYAKSAVAGVFDDLLSDLADPQTIFHLETLAAADVQQGKAPSLTLSIAEAMLDAETKEPANA